MVASPRRRPSHRRCAPLVLLALLLWPGGARAQESNPAPETFLRLTGIVRDARHGSLYCLATISRPGEPGYCDKKVNFELRSTDRLFEPSAASCSVTVTVLNDEQRTLRGALVKLEGEERGRLTDDAGRLTLDSIPAGLHLLRASVLGYFPQRKLVIVACAEGEPAEPVMFRMLPAPLH